MRLVRYATVAVVMGIVVLVRAREEKKQSQGTHTEAQSRLRDLTNIVTSRLRRLVGRHVTPIAEDDGAEVDIPATPLGAVKDKAVAMEDDVSEVKHSAAIGTQRELGESKEGNTASVSTGDLDASSKTNSSDEDRTENISDSDDFEDNEDATETSSNYVNLGDDAEAGVEDISDVVNWYDNYLDYDASDVEDNSEDLYVAEGELDDLPDTSDEYEPDFTASDDEDLAPPDFMEEAEGEVAVMDEAEGVSEVPLEEECSPEEAPEALLHMADPLHV